jgi:hypothetical protein
VNAVDVILFMASETDLRVISAPAAWDAGAMK